MPTCATYRPQQSLTAFQSWSVGVCNAGIRCTHVYTYNTTQTSYTQCNSTSGEPSLIHMNGRAYAPGLQRFLSPDPVLQAPANAQNHNRYAYCLNNPLRYTDPSGYFSVEELREILDEMHRLLDEANRMDLQLCVSSDGLGGGASGFGSVGGQLYSYENGTASLIDIGMPFYHMHEGATVHGRWNSDGSWTTTRVELPSWWGTVPEAGGSSSWSYSSMGSWNANWTDVCKGYSIKW